MEVASSLVSEGRNQIPWVLRVVVVVNSYKLLNVMVVINNNKVSNNKQRQEPDSVGLSRGSEW